MPISDEDQVVENHNFNVTALLNTLGAVPMRCDYDPIGNPAILDAYGVPILARRIREASPPAADCRPG